MYGEVFGGHLPEPLFGRGVYILLERLVELLDAAPCATYEEREDRLAAVFHPMFHALLAW